VDRIADYNLGNLSGYSLLGSHIVYFNATSSNNGRYRVVWRKSSSIGVKLDR
jgi:hypothetical protein